METFIFYHTNDTKESREKLKDKFIRFLQTTMDIGYGNLGK